MSLECRARTDLLLSIENDDYEAIDFRASDGVVGVGRYFPAEASSQSSSSSTHETFEGALLEDKTNPSSIRSRSKNDALRRRSDPLQAGLAALDRSFRISTSSASIGEGFRPGYGSGTRFFGGR